MVAQPALLLRRWLMRPQLKPNDTQVVLVNRGSTALYSGMVPGLVAGIYDLSECSIDLRDLCARAGVTFVRAEITGLDLPGAKLLLAGRPPLAFDRLSLDVGCQTRETAGQLGVKPLDILHGCSRHRARSASVGAGPRQWGWPSRWLPRPYCCCCALSSCTVRRRPTALGAPAGRGGDRAAVWADTPADLACTGSEAPPGGGQRPALRSPERQGLDGAEPGGGGPSPAVCFG